MRGRAQRGSEFAAIGQGIYRHACRVPGVVAGGGLVLGVELGQVLLVGISRRPDIDRVPRVVAGVKFEFVLGGSLSQRDGGALGRIQVFRHDRVVIFE